MELLKQPATHQNHDGAQHDGPDDADHQNALLELRGYGEIGEDQQEDKDVVHGQCFFNQVTGQEFQRLGVGQFDRTRGVLDGPPKQAVEQEAQGDPDDGPVERLFDADVLRALFFEDNEVDEKRHQNDADEGGP